MNTPGNSCLKIWLGLSRWVDRFRVCWNMLLFGFSSILIKKYPRSKFELRLWDHWSYFVSCISKLMTYPLYFTIFLHGGISCINIHICRRFWTTITKYICRLVCFWFHNLGQEFIGVKTSHIDDGNYVFVCEYYYWWRVWNVCLSLTLEWYIIWRVNSWGQFLLFLSNNNTNYCFVNNFHIFRNVLFTESIVQASREKLLCSVLDDSELGFRQITGNEGNWVNGRLWQIQHPKYSVWLEIVAIFKYRESTNHSYW